MGLEKITKKDILSYRHKRQQSKHGRKKDHPVQNSTINRELAQLRNLLNEAYEAELIDTMPRFKGVMLVEDNERNRCLSLDEEARLIVELPSHLKPMVVCALESGMRRGEITGMTWDHVDLDAGYIRLTDTKNKRRRKVPISLTFHDVLVALPRSIRTDHVFTYRGRRIGEIKTAWQSALQRAKIEDFKFHDLRHTFITRQRKSGTHDHVIMSIVGHRSLDMFRRYDTVDSEDKLEAVGRVKKKKAE